MIRVSISSSLVNRERPEIWRSSSSLKPELIEWLEEHTGQPMLLGCGTDRRLNPWSGWSWGGAIYGDRGGYIDFDSKLSRVAMLFKLTWGGK